LSWPELTSVGREFKLGGYTLTREFNGERPMVSLSAEGPPPCLPLAAMLQVSLTNTQSTATDPSQFPRNNDVALQQASLFYDGRIIEHLDAFAQWTSRPMRYSTEARRIGASRFSTYGKEAHIR